MHNFYKCAYFIYKMVEWPDEKLKNSFERKLKNWIDWSDNHIPDRMTLLEKKCSCGGKIYCCSADLGIVSYEPHSAHICDNPACDYVEKTRMRSLLDVVYPSTDNQEHCEICKRSKKE